MKRAFLISILAILALSFSASDLSAFLRRLDNPAIRKLPEKYTGGDIIVVTLDISPSLPHGTKIVEKVPDGWDLVAANPPLAKQPFRNMYVWEIPEKGETFRTIRYAVGIPKGNKSRKEFTGYIDISKSLRLTVSGDRHIWGE